MDKRKRFNESDDSSEEPRNLSKRKRTEEEESTGEDTDNRQPEIETSATVESSVYDAEEDDENEEGEGEGGVCCADGDNEDGEIEDEDVANWHVHNDEQYNDNEGDKEYYKDGDSEDEESEDEESEDEESEDEESEDEESEDEESEDEESEESEDEESEDEESEDEESEDEEYASRRHLLEHLRLLIRQRSVQIGRNSETLIQHLQQLANSISSDDVIAAPSIADPNLILPPNVSDTFHPFARLPAELRLEIWGLSRTQPHILNVKYQHEQFWYGKSFYHGTVTNICRWTFENRNNPFTSLAVCQESRLLALKSRFFADYEHIDMDDITQGYAWFNFKTDTILLSTSASCENRPTTGDPVFDLLGYGVYRTLVNAGQFFEARNYAASAGPSHAPLRQSVMQNLRFLAISACFWIDWPFGDEGHSNHYVFRMDVLRKLKNVQKIALWTDDILHGKELRLIRAATERQAYLKKRMEHEIIIVRSFQALHFPPINIDVVDLEICE